MNSYECEKNINFQEMEECGEESIKNEFYTCVKLPITNLIISLKMITDINVRSKTEVIRNRECLKL